jgi:hypothetical protein
MKVYVGIVTFQPSNETIQVRVAASRFAVAVSRAVDMAVQRRNPMMGTKVEAVQVDLRVVADNGRMP